MGPIETFLALVNKLIDLVKVRKQSRRDLFHDFVEPLFTELKPLVDDYYSLFRRTKELVENSRRSELSNALAEIKERRESMLYLRRKTVAMAEVVAAEVKDKKTAEFAGRVAAFFFCSQREGPKRWSDSKRVIVDLLDLVNDDGADRKLFLDNLTSTMDQMEESWVAIAQSYARLQVRMLKT